MDDRFARTALLFGDAAMERLRNAHVLVVGAGGVGGFACEALARSGIGAIDVLDFDAVELSNCNRQIIALTDTIGLQKADVMCQRIQAINPCCTATPHNLCFSADNSAQVLSVPYDYIIDAIDTVTAKLHLIEQAHERAIPILSALGTGNKSDPLQFRISDISKTSVCPLARVIRHTLRQRGILHTKVLWSPELPIKLPPHEGKLVASNSFTPSIAGLLMAREVILDLIK